MANKILPIENSLFKICSFEGCDKKQYRRDWCVKHYTRWLKYKDPAFVPRNNGEGNNAVERFWSRIKKSTVNSCWNWEACKDKDGYGLVRFNGKLARAHIVAWEQANKKLTSKFILHSCDNPPCCNPAHLREGTAKDNADDMVGKNRSLKGEKNHAARLNENEVIEIKKRIVIGETNIRLAKEFSVSHRTISAIKHGHIWKHVV